MDRLPKNILEHDGQRALADAMNTTFLAGEALQSPPPKGGSSMAVAAKGKPGGTAPSKPQEQVQKPAQVMSVFDTFSHGFDLPAGVQLNRIN